MNEILRFMQKRDERTDRRMDDHGLRPAGDNKLVNSSATDGLSRGVSLVKYNLFNFQHLSLVNTFHCNTSILKVVVALSLIETIKEMSLLKATDIIGSKKCSYW